MMMTTPSRRTGGVGRQPVGAPEWTLITPDEAYELLTEHNPRNRRIDNRKVAQYAADMADGRWDEDNGATIGLDSSGDIVDGQHRLTAVCDAGIPMHFWVMRGLDQQAQRTLDIGRRRELGAQLGIEGVKDSRVIAAAARMVYAYETTGSPSVQTLRVAPSDMQLRDVLNRHPGLTDSANSTGKVLGIPRATVVGLHYLFTYVDETDATMFFEYLHSGAGLEPKDPILTLRERLIKERQQGNDRRRMESRVLVAFIIRAFNAYRRGERLTRLVWSDGQVFPRIEGCTLPVNSTPEEE
jgi:hypothetical protein